MLVMLVPMSKSCARERIRPPLCMSGLPFVTIEPVFLHFEDRPSESPVVEKVWRARSDRADSFMSVAASHFEIAVTRLQGRTVLTLRGPETKATTVDCPADGEWLGIRFKLGTFIPRVPPGQLLDRNDVTLPDASSRSFWLDGSALGVSEFRERGDVRGEAHTEGHHHARPGCRRRRGRAAATAVFAIGSAALPACDRAHASRRPANRARPIRNEPAAPGHIHPRHRLRSWIFRSAAPHPIAEASGRTDARGARWGAAQLSFLYKTERRPWAYDSTQ